jgi:uncharacterized protein (DUF433 family)
MSHARITAQGEKMGQNQSDAQVESVVEISSDILGGTPVFRGTRVPITTLFDYLKAGDPLERFLDHFPTVTREQAVALLDELKDRFDAAA